MRRTLCLVVAAVALVLGFSTSSFGFASKGRDCAKCHTLGKDEAEGLLKKALPGVKVLGIRSTPVKSMWEIDVEADGKKGILYLDFSKKYLFSGSLIDIGAMKNLTQARFGEINRVDVSKIPLKDALVVGQRNARKRVIVFDDPDCPFCAGLYREMKKVVAERKDIVFYIKLFPLPMHKGAYDKAKAIVCEKSLSLLEDSFQNKPLPKPKCRTTAVDDTIALAKKLGISGAPVLVLQNGSIYSGYKDANALKALIDGK